MTQQSPNSSTQQWYNEYYQQKGSDRNNLLTNRGVLFQGLATEASIVSALREAHLEQSSAKILDVGCGGGGA